MNLIKYSTDWCFKCKHRYGLVNCEMNVDGFYLRNMNIIRECIDNSYYEMDERYNGKM